MTQQSSNLPIPVAFTTEGAQMPHQAYVGDGGYDLYATEEVTLKPFERALIGTGISVEIPLGYAGFVVPRSGLAIKQGLSLVNAPGLIDSNYRGEIKVIAINLDPKEPITVKVNDRIAQLVIMKVETVDFKQVDSLQGSERGAGGFGSSGVSGVKS